MDASSRRLRSALLLLLATFLIGVIGYQRIEGWNTFDALYMTVITLATVGYGETHPLSPAGRTFTVFLIMLGVGVLTYGVTAATAFVVEGTMTNLIGRRKMEADISKLRGHIILCGAGETGRHIAAELLKARVPFVVIDKDGERLKALDAAAHVLFIEGDATQDEVLARARIQDARGLISILPQDRDNVFVVLTARALNPRLRIISKVVELESRAKLAKAGADATVSSNFIGAMRMASEMIRPAVVSFLDTMLRADGGNVRVEEVRLPTGSALAGRTLQDARIYEQTGLLVIATSDGRTYEVNPNPALRLQEGSGLIVCCAPEQLARLRDLVK
ncbi:MAG: potassium channel protein [Candidatus Omnitrophica bacterium]|nr:potassium channel protein [Candidatus Omnitrophota bacterium]